MRIGIYGGSFDPIHLGHLWVAEAAREHLSLDQVRFVPAAVSPLKPNQPMGSNRQRMEMIELAIGGHPQFIADDREFRRGGISYTVDTLRELQSEIPDAIFYLIIGADSLNDFERWREPAELCRLAIPSVVARAGTPAPDWSVLTRIAGPDYAEEAKRSSIETPLIEVSSRDLRSRILQGKSIRYRTPRSVECYIQSSKLYLSEG